MKIKSTKFTGLKIIQSKNYRDSRGFFKEDFKKKFFKDKKFVFGCTSSSKKNVVRGLHLQTRFSQGKYISVLKGSIFDVAVDLRKNSKTFGKTYSIELSEKNCKSLYVPEGFAHAYYSFSKLNIIYYKLSNYYNPKYEDGILWNDKILNIKWPCKFPKLSDNDKKNARLKDINLYKYRDLLKL